MLTSTARETSYVAPMWRLDVTQDSARLTPQLVCNDFADPIRPRRFPLRDLPIRRVIMRPAQHGNEIMADIARLSVGSDGRIPPGPVGGFVEEPFASVDAWTSHTTFLYIVGPGALPKGNDPIQDFYADLGAIPGSVYRWEASPDGSWGIAHTTAEASLLARDRRSPHAHLPQIISGAFSRDGSRYAASILGPIIAGPLSERWSVFGRDGNILREGTARPARIDHVEFAPDAKSILVSWSRGDSYRVHLDTGEEEPLPVGWWDDDHYYSADGRTALEVSMKLGGGSLLRLFDCSDPARPILLGERLVLGTNIETAAVAPDGSLVALEESFGYPAAGHPMSVTVYDRRLQRRALLLGNTRRGGLEFAERYLFVGIGPAAFYARFGIRSTTGILVYDLSGL